jgi:hypothetical protein
MGQQRNPGKGKTNLLVYNLDRNCLNGILSRSRVLDGDGGGGGCVCVCEWEGREERQKRGGDWVKWRE